MPNPQVPQGVLNRLVSSVTFGSNAQLNVTASYLGKGNISIAFEGATTDSPETATGVVQSPRPFQMARVMIHMLRTQSLANVYRTQIESNTVIGDCDVRTDSAIFTPYSLTNCSISGQEVPTFDGQDPEYVVTISGIYAINSNLYS